MGIQEANFTHYKPKTLIESMRMSSFTFSTQVGLEILRLKRKKDVRRKISKLESYSQGMGIHFLFINE